MTQIFEQAMERPAWQRRAFLHRACGEDAQLRRAVESLMEAHEQAGDFLEQPIGRIPWWLRRR